MSTTTEDVLLVDGAGHPRILELPAALVPANVIEWPHPTMLEQAVPVMVKFDRQPDERDIDGRQVYRQRGTGAPAIRYEYLLKTPISRPATKLRIEDAPPRGDA